MKTRSRTVLVVTAMLIMVFSAALLPGGCRSADGEPVKTERPATTAGTATDEMSTGTIGSILEHIPKGYVLEEKM
ncbi:MAG: hypothetical protein GX113_00850 [Actinobacteria bacterium]|nr:hypothetical protein [Actinomycetota bacterium]